MRAAVFEEPGPAAVLQIVERETPSVGAGEVRVRIVLSAVNPTDTGSRAGRGVPDGVAPPRVPNQDGAGVVDAVGPGVEGLSVGHRVWLWEAAWQRTDGTAQEFVTVPARQAVPLPEKAPFELGAGLGIPALTAHRCLTVAEGGPSRLAPGALAGRTVLVAGGAGAVGNATIQLAKWAGATVITTVSSPEKATLATAAGADHVVNYRTENAAEVIRDHAPAGVDLIVEVSPATNAALDVAVAGPLATIAVYSTDGGDAATLPVFPLMYANIRYQFVLVYTIQPSTKDSAVADVSAALHAGALHAGRDAGLLDRTADAHTAVQSGAIGKVLIDVSA
ncbi:MAG TPA: NADPH:quinone reductase, partial [Actinophytocola sp.]|uniref:NADPH:quinone reductase n=1 Tax=Actinophytocola sp. TaxID=1872138 RepID=UPI002DFA5E2F|nr:NADPH:quinone reductase [Actinophytocola sp.]